MKRKALWAAVPYTVPVMLGYLFLGAAFGVLTAENGFSVLWAFLMSTFIYAGSMQFAAISLIVVGSDRFLLFSMAGILAALLLFRKEISK
jgi:predicted branched-subunit amino acid permease